MADGDTLQIVAGHQAFAAPVGGVQQISLIGPFRVDFDDVGIDGDGVVVATLDEGTLVLTAWLVCLTEFVANGSGSGHSAYVGLGPSSGTLTNYDTNFAPAGNLPEIAGLEALSDTAISHRPQFVSAGGQPLTVQVYPASGTFTAGATDCYAIVATPA
jgi:hypothetical protein